MYFVKTSANDTIAITDAEKFKFSVDRQYAEFMDKGVNLVAVVRADKIYGIFKQGNLSKMDFM